MNHTANLLNFFILNQIVPPNLIIPSPEKLQQKIATLHSAGSTQLHIVSDFDKTLTKAFVNGKKIQSSYALLRDNHYLSSEYVQKARALAEYYRPFETNLSISPEVRSQKMAKWWEKHHRLMVECGISQEVFRDLVQKNFLELRSNCDTFFHLLSKPKIPLLIFSSGLGDLILEFLKQKHFLTPNIHIISNFFSFDQQGQAIDHHHPLIHIFNKQEYEIKNTLYAQEITGRKNVILLGDSIGDLGMTEGIDHDTILRIGFLNEDIEQNLKLYSENFDVLVLNDDGMEYVNEILTKILSITSPPLQSFSRPL